MQADAPGHGSKIVFANACRGVAALSVVIVHLCISFWLAPAEVAHLTGLPAREWPPTDFALWLGGLPVNFAAFGVALFFVVSGFVIPISLERYGAAAFLAGRFVRIWPTYWAGFSISLLALAAGVAALGGARPFNAVQAVVHYFPPLRALVYSKPIDGIIWTLEIEFLWYGLAALIAGPLRRGALSTFLAPLALAVLFAALWGFAELRPASLAKAAERLEFLLIYAPFIIFIFTGVALNFRQRGLIGRPTCAALIGLCVALFMGAVATGRFAGIVVPGSYLAALALFVAAMAGQRRLPDLRLLRWLAAVSYPVYVVHGLAGYVALYALTAAGVTPVPALAIALAGALVLAALIHRFVETPSHALAQRLSRRLSSARKPSTVS